MTYALLIYRNAPAAERVPELDERATLDGHKLLQVEAAGRGQLHAVARLSDQVGAKTVRRRGGSHEISDGPYIETKEWLVGFYLIDCDSEEQALERARAICCDGAHAIEVRPVDWRYEAR